MPPDRRRTGGGNTRIPAISGRAAVLEAPRGQPGRPFSEKRRQNDSGTIRAGHRREWKNLAGGITGWNVEKVKDNVRDTFETRGKYPTSSVCFNEYVVSGNNSSLRLRARVFNNGVAFRYEWTEEVKKAPSLNISEEKTSFAFPEKPFCGPRTPPPPWAPARGSGLLPE